MKMPKLGVLFLEKAALTKRDGVSSVVLIWNIIIPLILMQSHLHICHAKLVPQAPPTLSALTTTLAYIGSTGVPVRQRVPAPCNEESGRLPPSRFIKLKLNSKVRSSLRPCGTELLQSFQYRIRIFFCRELRSQQQFS